MQISFLIVTRNRPTDLTLTLNRLKAIINPNIHEVRVFVDGCKATEEIIENFSWVKWMVSNVNISASPARAKLYKEALGTIFIGLDDDAHPLSDHFITSIESQFKIDASIGVLAFQEIRGLFKSDSEAKQKVKNDDAYFTSDFVGCGFAITKMAYTAIIGFPKFIDIYGEEPCVALQVLDAGFNIKYVPEIYVNHRVDIEKRKQLGRNYFRFEKQLKNSFRIFLVYYPKPLKSILKLFLHNFNKYALQDFTYFKLFFKVVLSEFIKLPSTFKYRKPVKKSTIVSMRQLKGLKY